MMEEVIALQNKERDCMNEYFNFMENSNGNDQRAIYCKQPTFEEDNDVRPNGFYLEKFQKFR